MMGQILEEVMRASADYATNFGDKCNLTMPPARQFAMLTRMDAPHF